MENGHDFYTELYKSNWEKIKFSKEHLKHKQETQVERQQRLNEKSKMIMYPKSTFIFGIPSDR